LIISVLFIVVHESNEADDNDTNTRTEMLVNGKEEEQSEAKENVTETYEKSGMFKYI
jgi:hypothetical protein